MNGVTPNGSAPSPAERTTSRRWLVKTTGWAVPTMAASVAAPAMAVSFPEGLVPQTVSWDANRDKEAVRTVRIPSFARNIQYVVYGGSGGSGPKVDWGLRGGNGARVSGRLIIPNEGSAAAQEVMLYGIAGGGSVSAPWERGALRYPTGYGNGGASLGTPFISTLYYHHWSERWNTSGGAGSALSIGACPEAGGQLVAVAGGGGAAGSGTYGRESASIGQWELRDRSGLGGNAALSGDAGGTTGVGVEWLDVFGPGGHGAVGTQGGAGGVSASGNVVIRNNSHKEHEERIDGLPGGNHGTGNHGGGNGGNPVQFDRTAPSYKAQLPNLIVLSSAGGGGGYAGGGSSGIVAASAEPAFKAGLINYSTQMAASGGGGGGSSFVADALTGGFRNVGTAIAAATGRAGNGKEGGTFTVNAEEHGEPGRIEITFWVPEDRAVRNPNNVYRSGVISC